MDIENALDSPKKQKDKYARLSGISSGSSSGSVEVLDNISDRRDRMFRSIVHRELFLLLVYATLGSMVIVLWLFVLTFCALPQYTKSMTSQNFISNNPIETEGQQVNGTLKWLEDYSRSAIPVMCHSHNDYTRAYPLFSALAAGCVSVEADIWLNADGNDLLVGHEARTLSPNKTLQSLYLDPLMEILDAMNPPDVWTNYSRTDQAFGVFRTEPTTTLMLYIDVKDDASKTWPLVMKQLEPLRQKLFLSRHMNIMENQTFWPGSITVVGTGNIVSQREVNIGANRSEWLEYHDVFLDAPLAALPEIGPADGDEDAEPSKGWLDNEFYAASVSFSKLFGPVRIGLTQSQRQKVRDQIQAAKQRGLKTRYYGLPSWPISYRDYVWRVLIEEGVDLLNADDIQSAAKRAWSRGYNKETIWICCVSAYLVCTSALLAWLSCRLIRKSQQRLGA